MDTANIVLEKYQIRKSSKQKTEFIEFVKKYSEENGYDCKIEKGALGARNIVVGDTEKADVVYTAHYDTCPVLPFPNFITPKKFSIYLLYQVVVTLGILLATVVLGTFVRVLIGVIATLANIDLESIQPFAPFIAYICLISIYLLMLNGPANKHTANDNTSGVVTLLEIMRKIPEDKRENAAFIFFDLEESGLFGSMGYASKHKDQKKDKLIVNFDCVSDGNNILLVVRNGARKDKDKLQKYFVGNEEFNVEIADKGVFYPSDQAIFNRGVGVASLKYSKKLKTLYMDKIHTKNDTVFEEKNIEFLSDCAVALAENE